MNTALQPLSATRLCTRCYRAAVQAQSRSRRALSSTSYRSAPPAPLKLAIIGAGPSGFYTASRVLSSLPSDSPSGRDVEVHMYERLPTPYGLVRYGVAPDHPEVKNCQHKFDELAKDSRFKYFGNVLITSQPSVPDHNASPASNTPSIPRTALSTYTYPHAIQLPLTSLLPHYNALLLSYGASLSNPLSSVAGSSSSSSPLTYVFPALALVGWYNGHPAFADLPVDLTNISDVSIVGQGNVALDVARILLKSAEDLATTDIPEDILHTLSQSSVKHVRAVGRRGPGQVAFTTKEFREILSIPDVGFEGVRGGMMDDAKELVKGDRMRSRILGLMEKDNKYRGNGKKSFQLEFLKSPTEFIGDGGGEVKEVEWAINQLLPSAPSLPDPPRSQLGSVPRPESAVAGSVEGGQAGTGLRAGGGSGTVIARPTDERVRNKADMIVESVGYRSEPLGQPGREGWELPFDVSRGRVRNVGGRVTAEDGLAIPGIYAAGWVARGPVGVIASTMHDAYSVADQMMADHFASPGAISSDAGGRGGGGGGGGLVSPLKSLPEVGLPEEIEKGLKEGMVVDLDKWGRIDQAERERAKKAGEGKEREKFRRVEEMLAVLA